LQNRRAKTAGICLGIIAMIAHPTSIAVAQSKLAKSATVSATKDSDGYPTTRAPDAIRNWLIASTNLPPSQVISIGSDMVVGFAQTGSLDPVTGHIKGAELRGEVMSAQFAKIIQGRSSLATLDVNCTAGSALIHQTKVYSRANLTGEATILAGSGTWLTPPKTAYLSEAIDAICRADFKRPLRDLPDTVVAATNLAKVPAAVSGPTTTLVTPAKVGVTEVQIVAASSAQAAEAARQQVLKRLPQIADNRPFRIETAVVGGRTYYRGLLGGFSDRAAAAAFCRTLSASNIGCLVR
jgi:hypothetical protein